MEPFTKRTVTDQPPSYTIHPAAVVQPEGNIGAPAVVFYPVLGTKPSNITCPSCRAQVMTRTQLDTTTKTHLVALLLCAVGCCICAWIPYFTDSCRTVSHSCPNCNAFIGVQTHS